MAKFQWLKPAVWGGILGAAAITIVGLSTGWVVTSGNAQYMVKQARQAAVISALTPICVAQFRSQPPEERQTTLAALEDESTWQRADFVANQGWATIPGSDEANDEVAKACASELLALNAT